MDIAQIRARLATHNAAIAKLRIKSLSVFGSAARGQTREGSDLDFLVQFEGPATFERYMELKELLESAFDVPIDLVTVRALKPLIRDRILNEAVKVA